MAYDMACTMPYAMAVAVLYVVLYAVALAVLSAMATVMIYVLATEKVHQSTPNTRFKISFTSLPLVISLRLASRSNACETDFDI